MTVTKETRDRPLWDLSIPKSRQAFFGVSSTNFGASNGSHNNNGTNRNTGLHNQGNSTKTHSDNAPFADSSHIPKHLNNNQNHYNNNNNNNSMNYNSRRTASKSPVSRMGTPQNYRRSKSEFSAKNPNNDINERINYNANKNTPNKNNPPLSRPTYHNNSQNIVSNGPTRGRGTEPREIRSKSPKFSSARNKSGNFDFLENKFSPRNNSARNNTSLRNNSARNNSARNNSARNNNRSQDPPPRRLSASKTLPLLTLDEANVSDSNITNRTNMTNLTNQTNMTNQTNQTHMKNSDNVESSDCCERSCRVIVRLRPETSVEVAGDPNGHICTSIHLDYSGILASAGEVGRCEGRGSNWLAAEDSQLEEDNFYSPRSEFLGGSFNAKTSRDFRYTSHCEGEYSPLSEIIPDEFTRSSPIPKIPPEHTLPSPHSSRSLASTTPRSLNNHNNTYNINNNYNHNSKKNKNPVPFTIQVSDDKLRQHKFKFEHVCDSDVDQQTFYNIVIGARENGEEEGIPGGRGIEAETMRHLHNFGGEIKNPPLNSPPKIRNPLVEALLNGFSASVIAYGQTGAGKTYTMLGQPTENCNFSIGDPLKQGVIPRLIIDLLTQSPPDYSFEMSFVEIYNDRMLDLLSASRETIKIRETSQGGVVLTDAVSVPLTSVQDAMVVIEAGSSQRSMAQMEANENSSRSHAIVLVTVTRRVSDFLPSQTSQLYLVDLAGSEKLSKSNASEDRLKESLAINKSLLALGNVIQSLTAAGPLHIPYRNSKLTRILRSSFGGGSRSVVLLCCSPHSFNCKETINTLRFGDRANRVSGTLKMQGNMSVEELKRQLNSTIRTMNDQKEELRFIRQMSERQNLCIKNLLLLTPEESSMREEQLNETRKALGDELFTLFEQSLALN